MSFQYSLFPDEEQAPEVSSKSYIRTQAHRDAMSRKLKGRAISQKTKDAVSQANAQRVWTQESRAAASRAHKGIPMSQAHREATSKGLKGRTFTQAHRDAISKARTGKRLSQEHKDKISRAGANRKHTQATKDAIGRAHRGRKLQESQIEALRIANAGKVISQETKLKLRAKARRGENSRFWKGGITPIHQAIRGSAAYKDWRNAVFARDNYTCVFCGYDKGGILNADHIKPFSLFPDLRFDVNNGRTLCIPCHKKTDTYGSNSIRKKNTNKTKD